MIRLDRKFVPTRLDALRRDVAYAWRTLRRAPGFTLAVVAVLALGLGANAALFSLLDRLFLSAPTGVEAPQQIRRLYYIQPHSELRAFEPANGVMEPMDFPEYAAIRASAPAGVQLAAYDMRPDSVELRVGNTIVSAMASFASASYFTALRVRPAVGRFFTSDDDRVQRVSDVAVIGDALWHRAFGGTRNVLGKQLRVGDRMVTVVGVAPPGFSGIDLDRADLWLPLGALPVPPFWGAQPWYTGGLHVLRVIARVPPTVADARVVAVGTAAYRAARQNAGVRDTTSMILTGPIVAALGPSTRTQEVSISLRLAGVSLILLLIAVGNVANLLLVRGMRRRREIAIRRALGVSTARLCRLLITESLLLSTLGAAAAVVIGTWGSVALRRLLMPDIHWASDSGFAHLLAFTVVVSVVVGTLAGLAPALHARGLDVTHALKGGEQSGRRRLWMQRVLTVGQIALSVVLLVGAGLFVRSLHNVRSVDLGFDAQGLVAVHARYSSLARSRELGSALPGIATELSRVPGVEHVAMASAAPMQGFMSQRLFLPDRDSVPTVDGMRPIDVLVSPGYFATTGVRLVAGRTLQPSDRAGAAPVAVVSRTMARVIWPGENPIGKCILPFARTAPCATVVGVVADTHTDGVVEPRQYMEYYLPFAQNPRLDSLRFGARGIERVLLVRARPGTEASVMAAALRITRAHLPGADSLRANDMAQVLAPDLRPWRLGATLFSALGVLAAIVALVGMYSVIAYAASQRAHEMSVRMALGARAQDILRLVAGEGLRVVFISIAIGVAAAAGTGRLVASLLYGVSPRDPLVLGGVALVLAVIGFVATLSPAIRAARSDPVKALRAE